ncbi:hypothetical protein AB1Y20_011966 [Prymnesium parvum]|mmetsp:Transcript_15375/g.36903  ORF Transcript_15375/g.36903 Transcript_15375/m.36903 type:complete len:447 (+) Transcript_15375:895-2235(+)
MWLYNRSYFKLRVPHHIPKPSVLYNRVRKVFAFFGPLRCSQTGNALFNDAAWKKANNVLSEIAKGHASDIPGKVYHRNAIDKHGAPLRDKDGLLLIESIRGTNIGEGIHRIFLKSLQMLHAGAALGDMCLTEKRHRYNHANAERTRPLFPKLGMCDTWLIDKLQNLCDALNIPRLYPHWSNTSDFVKTSELSTIVPVHDDELQAVVSRVKPAAEAKLTPDMKFLCKRLAIPLPFLPIHHQQERQLFATLINDFASQLGPVRFDDGATFDSHAMAIAFSKRADGVCIFPKLPVYLRQYHTHWQHAAIIKDALARLQEQLQSLHQDLDNEEREMPWYNVEVKKRSPQPPVGRHHQAVHFPPEVISTYTAMPMPPQFTACAPDMFVQQVDNVPLANPTLPTMGCISGRKPKRRCLRCATYAGANALTCKGRGGKNTIHASEILRFNLGS